MNEVSYLIKVYENQAAYDSMGGHVLFAGFGAMADAIDEARLWLPDWPIIKVESTDQEEIELLRVA